MFIAAITTILFPVCARTSVALVYFLRIVLGLAMVRKFVWQYQL
jgi:hypothetical protein